MTGQNDAPRDDNARLPMSRRHSFQQQITRHFKQNIADEINGLGGVSNLDYRRPVIQDSTHLDPIVLIGRHMQFRQNVAALAHL